MKDTSKKKRYRKDSKEQLSEETSKRKFKVKPQRQKQVHFLSVSKVKDLSSIKSKVMYQILSILVEADNANYNRRQVERYLNCTQVTDTSPLL